MDCEKYDKIALDLLYGELDELSAAAAKRHLEQCARCREIDLKLHATREVGKVPLLDVPTGFTDRVLAAERLQSRRLPVPQRVGRAISILAGYAMRPQLAMAAMLLLMIGSSLLFLRARPGERSTVLVTERGMPETEADSVILPSAKKADEVAAAPAIDALHQEPARQAQPQALGASAAATAEGAAKSARAKAGALDKESEARREAPSMPAADMAGPDDSAFGLGRAEEKDSAVDALQRARELQQSSGCAVAAPKFEEVAARYPGTSAASEATWRGAECHRLLGDVALARQQYTFLLDVSGYHDRAQAALKQLGSEPLAAAEAASEPTASNRGAGAPAAAAAAPPPAKPATKTRATEKSP